MGYLLHDSLCKICHPAWRLSFCLPLKSRKISIADLWYLHYILQDRQEQACPKGQRTKWLPRSHKKALAVLLNITQTSSNSHQISEQECGKNALQLGTLFCQHLCQRLQTKKGTGDIWSIATGQEGKSIFLLQGIFFIFRFTRKFLCIM